MRDSLPFFVTMEFVFNNLLRMNNTWEDEKLLL